MKMIVPNHNGFGNYELESSWGYIGHHILTLCYAGGCENSTLISVNPIRMKFQENNGNIIHLMKASSLVAQPSAETEVGATPKSLNSNYYSKLLNLTGSWAIVNPNFKLMNSENLNGTPTITFNNYIKHAHWKYTQYCCDVNIRKFTANVDHRTFEGYWEADITSLNLALFLVAKYKKHAQNAAVPYRIKIVDWVGCIDIKWHIVSFGFD